MKKPRTKAWIFKNQLPRSKRQLIRCSSFHHNNMGTRHVGSSMYAATSSVGPIRNVLRRNTNYFKKLKDYECQGNHRNTLILMRPK